MAHSNDRYDTMLSGIYRAFFFVHQSAPCCTLPYVALVRTLFPPPLSFPHVSLPLRTRPFTMLFMRSTAVVRSDCFTVTLGYVGPILRGSLVCT